MRVENAYREVLWCTVGHHRRQHHHLSIAGWCKSARPQVVAARWLLRRAHSPRMMSYTSGGAATGSSDQV